MWSSYTKDYEINGEVFRVLEHSTIRNMTGELTIEKFFHEAYCVVSTEYLVKRNLLFSPLIEK